MTAGDALLEIVHRLDTADLRRCNEAAAFREWYHYWRQRNREIIIEALLTEGE